MRIISDIILLAAIYLMPWWFTLLIASIFSFFFKNYLELPAAGFVIDEVWGSAGRFPFGFRFAAFSLAVLIFLAVYFLRKRLSFSEKQWGY